MDSPFGIDEGTVLVAVERANGGELAPLSQVLWTLDSFTAAGSRPTPAGFAASARLLIGFGLVECVEDQLGLTPEGRKLLRRSGLYNDPRHVAHVTALLQEFDELDVEQRTAPEPPPAPTEEDVRTARSDGEAAEESGEGFAGPLAGDEVPVGSTLFGGSPYMTQWVPAVPPEDSDESEMPPPPPPEYADALSHPVLNRLFGPRRRDRG